MLIVPTAPIDIVSSNIPMQELNQWVENGDYGLGIEIQYGNEIFKSLKENNNDEPILGSTSLSWEYISKINRYKMFDPYINTQTKFADKLEYTLKTSDVDIIAFFNLEAKSVRVEVFNAEGTNFYDKTITTYDRDATDWASWTTASANYAKSAFFKDLPFIFNSTMKITIENEGSIAKCGHCAFGESKSLGVTLVKPEPISSIRNVISKERLKDGKIQTENSMTYKRVTVNVLCDTKRAAEVQNICENYTVTPCIFVADSSEGGSDVLLTFGLYKDFDMPISLNKTQYELEIEGVI